MVGAEEEMRSNGVEGGVGVGTDEKEDDEAVEGMGMEEGVADPK